MTTVRIEPLTSSMGSRHAYHHATVAVARNCSCLNGQYRLAPSLYIQCQQPRPHFSDKRFISCSTNPIGTPVYSSSAAASGGGGEEPRGFGESAKNTASAICCVISEWAKNTASAICWGVLFTARLPNLILTSSGICHESPNPCGEQNRASDGR